MAADCNRLTDYDVVSRSFGNHNPIGEMTVSSSVSLTRSRMPNELGIYSRLYFGCCRRVGKLFRDQVLVVDTTRCLA